MERKFYLHPLTRSFACVSGLMEYIVSYEEDDLTSTHTSLAMVVYFVHCVGILGMNWCKSSPMCKHRQINI